MHCLFHNLITLDNDGKKIIEIIYDLKGNHLAQNHYEPECLKRQIVSRTYGKSASEGDIVKELQNRKFRPLIQFFVIKIRKPSSLASKFEATPRAAIAETAHTVSDGKTILHKKYIADVIQLVLNNINRFSSLQGKVQVDTKYQEVPRDQQGRFTQPANATRGDMAPVTGKKSLPSPNLRAQAK